MFSLIPLMRVHTLIRLDPMNAVVRGNSVLLFEKLIGMAGELIHYTCALPHGTHDRERDTGRLRQGTNAGGIACQSIWLELNYQPLRMRQ
jgi:hypothetical protein